MTNLDREQTPHLPIGEMIRREEEARRGGLQVELHAISDVGRTRASNEDHFLALRVGRTLEALDSNLPAEHLPPRLDQSGYVLMVADGIGGRLAGEHASRRALSALVEVATRIPDWILRLDEPRAAALMERAAAYFAEVDALLEAESAADPALAGMGTTMTVAYLLDQHLLIAHVGDSRAYRFRGGKLERLTRDQTMAQELADAGVIAESEVASHRQRHILTGALGVSAGAPKVELGRHALADGDRVLLASDGLSEMLPDEAIATILARHGSSREACAALVEAALAAGGLDNVTVIVARCTFAAGRG